VFQKDFGTDHYKRVLSSVADLEAHFAVDARHQIFIGGSKGRNAMISGTI
jgi:hypothetical protein